MAPNVGRGFFLAGIADMSVKALYDSGASISICDSRLWDQIQNKGYSVCDLEAPKITVMADGKTNEIRGFAWVPLRIGSKICKIKLYLLQGANIPLIVGIDTIRQFNLTYSPADDCLYLKTTDKHTVDEKIPLFPYISEVVPRLDSISAINIDPSVEPIQNPENVEFHFDHPDMTLDQAQQLREILARHQENFRAKKDLPMVGEPVMFHFDRNAPPIFKKNHFIPPDKLSILQKIVKDWEERGIVEKCLPNGYQTPIFLVKKKGTDQYRAVLQFKDHNQICSVSANPLNKIKHVLTKPTNDSKVESIIDMKDAFLAMTLHPDCRKLSTFYVKGLGWYWFVRCFFGQNSIAQLYFDRIMEMIKELEELAEDVDAYQDDLRLRAKDIPSMMLLIDRVLTLLNKYQVQVNWKKSVFCRQYVIFLGMVVGQNTIAVHHEMIVDVLSTPRPNTPKKLHSWLAKISYFRGHLPNLGVHISPLQKMLRKGQEFKWTSVNAKVWEDALKYLASPDVLHVPAWGKPFRLYIYSKIGCSVAGMLTQDIDGVEKTIAHCAHVCNPGQEKYDAKILDCLATVLSLESFQYFLRGSSVEIISSEGGLDWLLAINEPRHMLQRWLLRISQFDITNYPITKTVDTDNPPTIHADENLSNPCIPESQRQQFRLKIQEFQESNKSSSGKVECCPYSIEIVNPEIKPTRARFADLNPQERSKLARKAKQLVQEEMIQPGNGAWSRSCIPIEQENEVSIQIDHRVHNSRTVPVEETQALRMEQILKRLEAPYVSFLNFESGDNLLPILNTNSKERSAIVIEGAGLFESLWVDRNWFNHRAFLHNLIFEKVMDLENCIVANGFMYVVSQDCLQNLETLNTIFKRLKELSVKVNLELSRFLPSSFSAFGYRFVGGKANALRDEVVERWQQPTTYEQACSLLKAVEGLSDGSGKILDFLPKPGQFLGSSGNEVFARIQKRIQEMTFYIPEKDDITHLACDTSAKGWGAHAYVMKDDQKLSIDFWSESLPHNVQMGSATTLEAYGAQATIRHFRHLVRPGKTELSTDHSSLKFLNNMKESSKGGAAARQLSLAGVRIKYISGKVNCLPDWLSRNPHTITPISEFPMIGAIEIEPDGLLSKIAKSSCSWYQDLRSKIEKTPINFPDFRISNNRVIKVIQNKITGVRRETFVVPSEMRTEVLQKYHSEGHWGVDKTYNRLAEKFYWAKMKSSVKLFIQTCLQCQAVKKTTSDTKAGEMAPYIPKEIASGACWYLDYVGPLIPDNGYKYLLVAVCAATNWVIAIPTRRATAKEVIKMIETEILAVTGRVELIVADNGPAFIAKELQEFLKRKRISSHLIPYYAPWTNRCERANGSIKRLLKTFVKTQRKWTDTIPAILFAMRTCRTVVSRFSAAELFLGHQPRPWFEEDLPVVNGEAVLPDTNERAAAQKKIRDKMYQAAAQFVEKYKAEQREKYNKTHKKITYEPGDLVWVKSLGVKSNKAKKFSSKMVAPWRGIMRIKTRHSDTQYQLETLHGVDAGRHHVVNLKSANIPPDVTCEQLKNSPWAGHTVEDSPEEDVELPIHNYNLRSRR